MSVAAETFRGEISANIQRTGVHVWGIFGDPNAAPFVYTTGLSEKDLPEFLLAGFEIQGAHWITMQLVNALREGKRGAFENGEIFYVDNDPTKAVLIVDARESVKDDYTVQTGQYYNDESYRVQQLIIPDEEGRLPNHPDCKYNHQPMLGADPIAAQTIAGLRN